MPKVPTYQLQAQPGGAGPLFPDATNLSTPYARTVAGVGHMLERRSEQILAEYDSTKAYSAFSQLRDNARVKMNDLLSREGSNAQGIQTEYDEWERTEREKITKDSLSAYSQKSLFDKVAQQHRSADLNSLAGHEMQQHRVFKKQTIDGLTNVLERDIRNSAFDDAEMDGQINNYFEAMERLYPGSDKTADKLAALQVFRVSAMKELIDKNPKYAAEKLEQWKPDLGDKYDVLKKQLETVNEDNKLDAAYGQVNGMFGSNHERALSWLAVPANQKALGLDFKEVNKLHNRFSQLLSDRERIERIGRDRLDQAQKDNSRAVLQSLYNPNAPKVDYHELHKRRLISDSVYEHAIKARESTVVDNPWAVSEIYDDISRGLDPTDKIRAAVDNGTLSEKTAANTLKHASDEESKQAMALLENGLKPSGADKWSPDLNQRLTDAKVLYFAKVGAGADKFKASQEILKAYLDEARRTLKGLFRPKFIEGEKTDPIALEKAKSATAEAFRSGRLTIDEFNAEFRNIENLIKIAEEAAKIEESSKDMQEIRRRRIASGQ